MGIAGVSLAVNQLVNQTKLQDCRYVGTQSKSNDYFHLQKDKLWKVYFFLFLFVYLFIYLFFGLPKEKGKNVIYTSIKVESEILLGAKKIICV